MKDSDDNQEKIIQGHNQAPRPIPELFQEEQSALTKKTNEVGVVAAKFPQLVEVQSGLYKNRSKKFPTLPKSVQDLISKYLLTESGQRFLLSHRTYRNTLQKTIESSVIY